MKKLIVLLLLIPTYLLLISLSPEPRTTLAIEANTPVWEVLQYFGEPAPNHFIDNLTTDARIEVGRNIVVNGISPSSVGKRAGLQSKHFVCTSCHNIQREDPNLKVSDPQARLEFAHKNGIPFLQGTTLYGVVNRTRFYNDDYEKKYGDLVKPTRNNLREAIQLCAVECSQGRRLETWELESVLAYLWTLQLKIDDLNLTDTELQKLQEASVKHADEKSNSSIISHLKSYYLQGSPATFVKPPPNRREGYNHTGNPENGRLIYDLSCKHCHEYQRYSFFNLDDSKMTFNYLKKHFKKYSHASVYQVARYGTSPLPGKMAYMPQYTKEKMSDQQMEDLRAYIEMKAEE